MVGGLLAGCFHEQAGSPPTEDALEVSQEAPSEAQQNQPFTVAVTVTASKAVPAISIRTDFDGLTLVDKGDFLSVDGNVLQAVVIQPAAGDSQTFEFQVECTEQVAYSITAIAQSRDITPVWNTSSVQCGG